MRSLILALAMAALVLAPAAAQASQKTKAAKPAASSAAPSSPVNLNTATQQQLESLPGIGPRAAERILEYRQKNGSFKKIEELMNVKGIGEKSFLKLKPLITVSGGKAGAGAGKR